MGCLLLVDTVHRALETLGEKRLDRIRGPRLRRCKTPGLVARRHAEDPARWHLTGERPADTDLHTDESRVAERRDHGLDAVVPAGTAAAADPHPPDVEVDVVVDRDHVLQRDAVEALDARGRRAGLVHVGLWLHEQHTFAGAARLAHEGAVRFTLDLDAPA